MFAVGPRADCRERGRARSIAWSSVGRSRRTGSGSLATGFEASSFPWHVLSYPVVVGIADEDGKVRNVISEFRIGLGALLIARRAWRKVLDPWLP